MKKAVCSFVAATLAVAGLIIAAPSASAATAYTIAAGDASASEQAGTLCAPVTINTPVQPGESVVVTANTNNQTAAAPGDFTDIAATAVSFDPGDPLTQCVNVTIINDALAEGNETFTLDLTPAASTLLAGSSATITDAQGVETIVDDENAPGGFAFASNPSDPEGTAGFSFLDVVVTLNPAPPAGCTQSVTINTADGTASAGIDYNSLATVVNFGPGVGAVDVFSTTIPDATVEPDETFTWNLTNPTSTCGAPPTITDAQATHTIQNDDGTTPTPTPTQPSVSLVLDKVGKKKCTLSTVLSAPAAGVTVDILKNGNLKFDNAAVPGTFKVRRGANDKTLSLADPQGATLGSPSSQVCPDK